MADIAFLLLIFFLVTTTVNVDKGLFVVLPPWSDDIPPVVEINDRNTFVILLNSYDQLLVEGELLKVKRLKEEVIEFLDNPSRKAHLADSPTKAVISFKNDRDTTYDSYIQVWNELKASYTELCNKEAMNQFGVEYSELKGDIVKQKSVRAVYPMRISEAEPEDVQKSQ